VIFIDVVTYGSEDYGYSGFVVARDTGPEPAVALVVGQVWCWLVKATGKEQWKAYLWPRSSAYPPLDTHTEAVERGSAKALTKALRDRYKKTGAWWA
jgi:hypothetical protein